jgi:hypothetical protein
LPDGGVVRYELDADALIAFSQDNNEKEKEPMCPKKLKK